MFFLGFFVLNSVRLPWTNNDRNTNGNCGGAAGGNIHSGCQDTPWFVLLLPYFEGTTIANAFNYTVGSGGPLTGAGSSGSSGSAGLRDEARNSSMTIWRMFREAYA